MTLPEVSPTRKQRFEAALSLAGLSYREWCEAQGISRQHLYVVLIGERPASAELNAAIDATIEKYLITAA
jgi:hypothetical protein